VLLLPILSNDVSCAPASHPDAVPYDTPIPAKSLRIFSSGQGNQPKKIFCGIFGLPGYCQYNHSMTQSSVTKK
jgi:hypothetical protein